MTSKTTKATKATKATKTGKADRSQTARARAREKLAAQRAAEQRRQRRNRTLIPAIVVVAVFLVVGGLYAAFRSSPSNTAAGTTPRSDYQVGRPGPGEAASDFTLASSTGGQVKLSAYRGKSVLLYFQEGLSCQPCWDQITDLEKNAGTVKAAGIDQVLSITTDPANLTARKVSDMNLTTPVLSDPDVKVSQAYEANKYRMQMMAPNVNGHSFILVGPDGKISWRADYGGPPKEIMYLPVDRLLTDIKAGNR